ncbi:hypothetical protein F511_40609 [Dorcoceras hygrometricum]|uniref:Uncharacterized protein n=1 Tax=Dorcoceras hygrometricum TaxID=472368 RepID=A0A2Z7CHM6_9LAMI|nr:hypothetical protein F511_40609 [Dorcoceras hygrometricum]
MSGRGRGRRSYSEEDNESEGFNPVLNSMAQLLERLVDQTSNVNVQTSSRIVSREDPQEKFRRQRPQEFSGTTDPLVAESWIKSMEVIFEYLHLTELERPRDTASRGPTTLVAPESQFQTFPSDHGKRV